MSQHTPEPWYVGTWKYWAGNTYYANIRPIGWDDDTSSGLAKVMAVSEDAEGIEDSEYAANARRIVACVNTCRGIPTEALEGGAVAGLVAACEEALRVVNNHTTSPIPASAYNRLARVLGDAIGQANGGA